MIQSASQGGGESGALERRGSGRFVKGKKIAFLQGITIGKRRSESQNF